MSGSRFEGIDGAVPSPQGEDYLPGKPDYDLGYVTALVEAFGEVDPFHLIREPDRAASCYGRYAGTHRRLMSLLEQVPERAGGDVAGFLDCVIMQAGHRLEGLQAEFSFPLFSEIIQRLYSAGHNDFLLDFTDAPALASQIGAYGLSGTEENPLSLTVLLPGPQYSLRMSSCVEENPLSLTVLLPGIARNCGNHLVNCVLTVKGSAFTGGTESASSEFIIDGRLENLGQMSEDCIYRLRGAEFADIEDDSDMGAWAEVFFYRIHLLRDGEADEVRVLSDFFEKGNRLYVGDESCWTEVRP